MDSLPRKMQTNETGEEETDAFPAFNRKLLLEALQGGEAARHGAAPQQMSKWKAEARNGHVEAFARTG